MSSLKQNGQQYNKWIIILSILIPIAVAGLFGLRIPNVARLGFLPPIYATINGVTACLLIVAVWSIKNGNRQRHEILMKICIGLSMLFLVLYIAYHATSDATKYGDLDHNGLLSNGELAAIGMMRYVYYFILISHIVLSIAVIPLVLISFARAWSGNFIQHKKVAKIAFPIWLYVAISGVVVYSMIAPYYPV